MFEHILLCISNGFSITKANSKNVSSWLYWGMPGHHSIRYLWLPQWDVRCSILFHCIDSRVWKHFQRYTCMSYTECFNVAALNKKICLDFTEWNHLFFRQLSFFATLSFAPKFLSCLLLFYQIEIVAISLPVLAVCTSLFQMIQTKRNRNTL
jgi:hypothetical protein